VLPELRTVLSFETGPGETEIRARALERAGESVAYNWGEKWS